MLIFLEEYPILILFSRYLYMSFHFLSYHDNPEWVMASWLASLHNHNQDTPHSVGLLWTSDQPDAETSNWKHIFSQERDIRDTVGYETTISKRERRQTYALTLYYQSNILYTVHKVCKDIREVDNDKSSQKCRNNFTGVLPTSFRMPPVLAVMEM